MKSTRKATFRDGIAAEKVLKATKTDKPSIELKSIQVHLGLSEETPAYTAKLFVDGAYFADVKNDGHGGNDYVYRPNSKQIHFDDDRLADLEKRIAATYPQHSFGENSANGESYPPMDECLEILCHNAVWRHVDERNFRSTLSRNLVALDNGKIFAYTKKGHDLDVMRGAIKAKRPDSTILNDLPFDEAFGIVQANS